MDSINIRMAALEDAKCILKIYEYYVKNTAITFEYDVPTRTEFEERMRTTMKRYPYLVAERNGEILGYAYANPLKERAAYNWSCELTIYLDRSVQKCGLGKRLYEELEAQLKEMGIVNLYVCIGYPETEDQYLTKNSAKFHEHIGYTKIGEFHKCGYKFNRWYNMIWMEKIIGEHKENQKPVTNSNI